MLNYTLRSLFNPEMFQGKGKKKSYFEGWYFKLVDHKEQYAFAIIPGIAFDSEGNGHSFIQVLDGKNCSSEYHSFPADLFWASETLFEIKINTNKFSSKGIELDLPNLKASIQFGKNVPWPKPFYSPGIMGPFAFLPYMECYHGIVSMNHTLSGYMHSDNKTIDMTNGKGYIEKDWGSSFPSAYVWMQSNHFDEENVSFKCSIAKIPFLGTSFVGFIAGLWLKGELIRFTTYNRCRLKECNIQNDYISITLDHPNYTLEIYVEKEISTSLASPINGFMNGRIEESMTACPVLKLIHKSSKEVTTLKGRNAGLEVAGNIEEIIKQR